MTYPVSLHVRTGDLGAVCSAMEALLPADALFAVGAAGPWVGVFPDPTMPVAEVERLAWALGGATRATVMSVWVSSPDQGQVALHVEGGTRAPSIRWREGALEIDVEMLQVELRRWLAVLNEPSQESVLLNPAWIDDAVTFVRELTAFFAVDNGAWTATDLLSDGDAEAVEGWDTFRARIDGGWMLLAERRWLEPPVWTKRTMVPLSRAPELGETGEFDVSDLDGPAVWFEPLEDPIEAGTVVPVTVFLAAGPEPLLLEGLMVRVSGIVSHLGQAQHYESGHDVARGVRVDAEGSLSTTVLLDLPAQALFPHEGAWRVHATATFADGAFVHAEMTLPALEAEEDEESDGELDTASTPGDELGTEAALLRWGGHEFAFAPTQLSDLVLNAPLQLPDGAVMFDGDLLLARFVGASGVANLEHVADDGARLRIWQDQDRSLLELAVRPSLRLDADTVLRWVLGCPLHDVLADALDPELELPPLARLDQVQRRVLAAVARGLLAPPDGTSDELLDAVVEHIERVQGGARDVSSTQRGALTSAFRTIVSRHGLLTLAGARSATLEPDLPPATHQRAAAALAARQPDEVVVMVDQAVAAGLLDARLYAAKAAALEQIGIDMRRYGRRTGFNEWTYTEGYRARAQGLRAQMERTLRVSLWIEPRPEVAAQLASALKHPLEALQAWQRALALEPDDPNHKIGLAAATMRVESASATDAIALLDGITAPHPAGTEGARSIWGRALHHKALLRVTRAFRGGEPAYLHFGLEGEPTPVRPTGQAADALAQSIAELEAMRAVLSGAPAADSTHEVEARLLDETGYLLERLRPLAHAAATCGEGGLDRVAARAMASLARRYGIETLGRWVSAIARRGQYEDRDPKDLIERAMLCQAVYAHEAADGLLERARVLSSRPLVPVLDAEVAVLRARGQESAALRAETVILRVAPEQSERSADVFQRLVQQGELGLAEELVKFYLFEVVGSRVVAERLVQWAQQLSNVYRALEDPARALRPLEWLLHVGHGLTDEERAILREKRDDIARNLPSAQWDENPPSDEGLAQ